MGMLANLVQETCTNPGTGSFTLNGSPVGYIPFVQAIGNGQSCFYVARSADLTLIEIGRGTVTAGTPNTLSRDLVIWNSQVLTANPTKLSFTGTISVYNDLPAERTPALNDDGSLSLKVGNAVASLVKRASDFLPIFQQTGTVGGSLGTSDATQLTASFTAVASNLFATATASVVNNDAAGNYQDAIASLVCSNGASSTAQTGFIGTGSGVQVAQVTTFFMIAGLTIGTAYTLKLNLRKANATGTVTIDGVQIGGINF